MTKEKLSQEFSSRFHAEPTHFFYCPGRVNLIGEHIDYNGGEVMPCAIARGTWLAVSRNSEKELQFQCLNFPETATFKLQSSYTKNGKAWYNYPLGVINEILKQKDHVGGLNMLFYGDIPIGAGLSSSASIEVVTGFALEELFDLQISRPDIAVMSKNAENNFVGVNCGIMDQFAVAMGRKDQAILLNCDTLAHEYLPFKTGDYELVIINTNKQRSLADSKYNERFAECRAALKLLKKELPVNNLCEISMHQFDMHSTLLTDPVLFRRAKHVISEMQRVKDATIALQTSDLETFGKIMYASHESLRHDYEVSCAELDTAVDFCRDYKGCCGARMTGAGFGGCAIALVLKRSISDFSEKLTGHYNQVIGYPPEVFASLAEEGVHSLS
jgi:galactokinase